MMRNMKAALAVAAATLGVAGPAAATPILDFTASSPSTPLSGVFQGVSYDITGSDSVTNSQSQDGNTCPVGVLACELDGVGIVDDEVTATTVQSGQTLSVEFGAVIRLAGIHFLDLFTADDGDTREQAQVSVNGGAFTAINAAATERPGDGNSGYLFHALDSVGVTSLTFTAFSDAGLNDDLGENDFALAAIQAVPLPPTLLLMGLGLAGLGLTRRRQ